MKPRPLSPFMIGPYYRPQLTSVLSIMHRLTGVILSIVGAPLLLWWLVAAGSGMEAYRSMSSCLSGFFGTVLAIVCVFSLSFHFCNGIRHLIWDTGRMLEIKQAYLSGWLVLAGSLVLSCIVLVALL